MEDYKGKRCAVVGAGRSGLSVATLLARKGANVLVSDARSELDPTAVERIESIGATLELGGHSDDILSCDLVVLSPGVNPAISVVQEALGHGLPVTNEIEVAAGFCRGLIIGITGTNGKTTTSELTGHILRTVGRTTFVAGNVGTPLSEIALETDDSSVTVLELSSFQLERVVSFHPDVAVLLNVTPDHLDRYADIEEYGSTKLKIMTNQTEQDLVIYSADDDWLTRLNDFDLKPERMRFSVNGRVSRGAWVEDGIVEIQRGDRSRQRLMAVEDIGIRGPHNVANAMAAALAADRCGASLEHIRDGLRSFRPLPHRMEEVAEVDGVRFVNDSKGTNIEALKSALESYDRPVVLIAGGRAKQNEYMSLVPLVKERVKKMIVIGEEAEQLEKAFGGLTEIENAGTDFRWAIRSARESAEPGDVVLLSPACASFDMFRDYADRGDQFRDCVKSMMERVE
jgi:UDP-N-acetylmuramoylalanine--D-glutamate ligase